MDMNAEKSYSLLDNMDRGLHENIIRLDQKLKGLRAEITAKLESPSLIEEGIRDEYIQKLSTISKEVDAAIAGIDALVGLVSHDHEAANQFLQSEEMQRFSEMISENLEKISEFKDTF